MNRSRFAVRVLLAFIVGSTVGFAVGFLTVWFLR